MRTRDLERFEFRRTPPVDHPEVTAMAVTALWPGDARGELDRREAACRALALSAGQLASRALADRGSGGAVSLKGPQDFLTETDAAVEQHLREGIAAAFPEDGVFGEESGGVLKDRVWVVDPIDGTANFARAIPHFCISIAFVSARQVELGAICNPSAGELYF